MSSSSYKQCEFGKYPSDWKLEKLGEHISILTDYHANGSYKKLKENVELLDKEDYAYMIRTTNFEQNAFEKSDFKYITESAYNFLEKTKVYKNDILMNKIANAGSVYLVPKLNKPISLAMNLFLIRMDNESLDQKYSYYFMKNYERYIKTRAEGSVTKTITKENVKKLQIAYPAIQEQKSIVNVLENIEGKIEINNRINKKLEEMAQAIFKQWFVDFEFPNEDGEPYKSSGGEMNESEMGMIPKGWEIKSLLDVANYLNGLAMQKFRPVEDEKAIPVLKIKELRQGRTDENSDLCSPSVSKDYIIHDGDVIFSWSGSLLVDFWCGGKCGLNQHLFKVSSNEFEKWFYYMWTKYHLDKFIRIAQDKATTMGHIKRGDLSSSMVLVPNAELMNKANFILKPIVEKIIETRIEERKLGRLRDTLLPKLMSGEMRVNLEV